jgi:hypothetical protein
MCASKIASTLGVDDGVGDGLGVAVGDGDAVAIVGVGVGVATAAGFAHAATRTIPATSILIKDIPHPP